MQRAAELVMASRRRFAAARCLCRTLATIAASLAVACASSPAPPSPASSGERASAYPGPCSFVELQASERPSPGRGATPDNLGTDSIEVVATYRPSGGGQRRPVGYAFRVEEEQVDDLRAHLQQQPEILCEGESAGKDVNPKGSSAPTFQGQPGRRLPDESP
jgi:hypothetical protein